MITPQQKQRIFAALTVAVGFSTIASLRVDAAIVTVNNSGSWINGADTIANQGFDLIPIPNGSEAIGTSLSSLSSPLGDIELSPSVTKQQVGVTWLTWSNGYQGEVYSTNGNTTLDIKLPNLAAFDFYAQPDKFDLFTISAVAQSGDVLSQVVNGRSGAQYFGFYSDSPLDPLQSIRITADPQSEGLAIAQLRGAKTAVVPTPLLLPGMIGLGLGLWRKARNRQNDN